MAKEQIANTDVSIIIVNYNTFQLTCNCIQSILQYTKNICFELILVDNGSVECNASLFVQKFPEIILVKNKINSGFAGGNNLGLPYANGKYILLLNSDTELKDNAVKATFDYMELHPEAGVVTLRLVFPDGCYQCVCQRFPSIKFQLFELLRLQKFLSKKKAGKILLGAFFDYNETVITDWVWGTYFMFQSKILAGLKNNKLDDLFFMYTEDMQWCWDIKKSGYEIHFYSGAEIIHYMGGSSANREQLMSANYKIFMKRNYNFFHRECISVINKLLK